MKEWLKRKDREWGKPAEGSSEYQSAVLTWITMIGTLLFVEVGVLSWVSIPTLGAMIGTVFLFRWWIRRE